ncbi:JAB domain-containing protein [Fuerstiella marisgermanici]|uniref:DNA repair protein n=1 Tax=Fuerstiella marisgermanici TaxID=1891926 RepID=A0A1P8WP93_9PLAN|nr:JAB domain-containing protein [Fuerstiella marisgermanici]APZ95879.1 DNA repair protein [Fuerstiella marisgermanici]
MLLQIKEEFSRVKGADTLASVAKLMLSREHVFDQQKEHFVGVGLSVKNDIQYVDLISLGTLDASLVHPRECFRHAVEHGVSSIAFIHNHPSGDVEPSPQDEKVTERLIAAGNILGIEVLDHVIVGNESDAFYSFRSRQVGLWL